MKKIIAVILCIALCCIPINAYANDEIVEIFDPLILEVLQDGKLYSGILISELEYNRYVEIEKELLITEQKLKIYETTDKKYESLLLKWDDSVDFLKNDLKKIEKELNKPVSVWQEYKFEFGLGIGILATIATVLLVKNL